MEFLCKLEVPKSKNLTERGLEATAARSEA